MNMFHLKTLKNLIKSLQKDISSDKLEAPYFWLVGQTVQSRQLMQLGESAVIDTEVQVLVQDTEILIAALHNPTATLQSDDSLHLAMNNISENFKKMLSSTASEERSYDKRPKICTYNCRLKVWIVQNPSFFFWFILCSQTEQLTTSQHRQEAHGRKKKHTELRFGPLSAPQRF